ncbi:MAG TPA: hypothetical protein VIP05_02565 [Burkholderiaceae bacterium]
MRPAALSLSLAMLAVAGCQSVPLAPEAATPHARLASSHVDVNDDRTDVFRVLAVDGRDVIDPTDLSSKSVEIDHTHVLVAGRPAHLSVDALAYYTNTARRLFWDAMRVRGTIDFVPAADATYVMRGELTPDRSSVWLEDAATHEVVGQKVSMVGRGIANAQAAASAAERTQASHPIGER